ncbi:MULTISPECIES: nucleoside recognition domain-containing protein [Paraclostridium]|uniref:Spore maturation protein n=1 Tax=Paraclostridium benzoelyticum TaxID=1629550 RepID=A0A0M3DN19_9FIRM|nr:MULTISPECIES: nucleoside recognition domain-containing protein [Paraclostridium]KKY02812.1 spore maturation protein [Paraclostridium benzoelyticum]MCU9815105.1 spore maturation protein [Paraclostridium sp. AKS73]MDM8127631.1 nucleoside recognition domain-containing protein [Paraclostridium benzoelyticum]OXX82659.1 spore maturation protein [Paraclostridium benzoelyticum]
MGKIWFWMISIGIVGSICTNNLAQLNEVILNESSKGIEFAVSLAGIMALWMGIMNIAKDSGLINKIGDILYPILKKIFPSIPKGHKAMSYIVMNMVLNMLGAGNGATAFGLKAMNELQTLNKRKDTATNDMVMFLVINISSIQIIPFTMIKLRLDGGSSNPGEVIISTLFATIVSTIVAITSCKFLQRRRYK